MQQTGMSKKALQYYEDKHLIHVKKDSNGYRIYDEVCLKRLWNIKVLRKLDFSIAEIYEILNGSDREEIFSQHFNEIDRRMAQCNIQKEYLKQLYEESDETNDVSLFQYIDEEMEEDFKRNKEIIVDMRYKKINWVRVFFLILGTIYGLLCLTSETYFIIGLLILFSVVYSFIDYRKNMDTPMDMNLFTMMVYDLRSKLRLYYARRRKK